MLLNEVYFGKTKEFEMLEGFLKSYIRKDEDLFNDTLFVKDFKNIKENIEKAFGKRFNINLHLTIKIGSSQNACTVPQQFIGKKGEEKSHFDNTYDLIEKTSNGYRFKKRTDIYVLLFLPIIRMINERELIALILHEVGHNMFSFTLTTKLINIMTFCGSFIEHKEIKEMLETDILSDNKKNKAEEKKLRFSDALTYFIATLGYIFYIISLVLKSMGGLTLIIFPIISFFSSIVAFFESTFLSGSYANEEFADNFANIHGYGPELATGLIKFNNPKYFDKKSIFEKCTYLLLDIVFIFNVTIGDEHPQTRTRFSNIEKYIKKELILEANPEKIKLLNKQLDDLKVIDEDYKKEFSFLKRSGLGFKSLIDIFKKAASVGQIDTDKFDEKVSVKKV